MEVKKSIDLLIDKSTKPIVRFVGAWDILEQTKPGRVFSREDTEKRKADEAA